MRETSAAITIGLAGGGNRALADRLTHFERRI
jgi:hypothetical protein